MTQFNENILAGRTGDGTPITYGVRVYDVPAATVVVIPIPEVTGGDPNGDAVWMNLRADPYIVAGVTVGGLYVIVGLVDVPNPDPTARSGGANDAKQCVFVPAGEEYRRLFDKNRTTIKVYNPDVANAVVVRLERTSLIAGGNNLNA